MASLRKLVGFLRDELRDGIANVVFWKDGRGWNAEVFYLDINDCFELEDIEKIEEILSIDKNAIIVDGYYTCPFTNGDEDGKASSIEFMTTHIRWRYEEHHCQLVDFYSSHNKEALEISREFVFRLDNTTMCAKKIIHEVGKTIGTKEDVTGLRFFNGDGNRSPP